MLASFLDCALKLKAAGSPVSNQYQWWRIRISFRPLTTDSATMNGFHRRRSLSDAAWWDRWHRTDHSSPVVCKCFLINCQLKKRREASYRGEKTSAMRQNSSASSPHVAFAVILAFSATLKYFGNSPPFDSESSGCILSGSCRRSVKE